MGGEFMAIALFLCLCLALMAGFPVAFTLGGVSLLFAGIGILFNLFEPSFLGALPSRLYGTMTNQTLMAVPLFVFMGVMLEKSRIAEDLLDAMARLFGGLRGGLAFSVCIVGALLAASTGIVGATVVTLGLLALPTMLRRGYDPALATGTLAATGTLGQIIPPSIILVLLGDVLANAYQQAQQKLGIFSPKTVTVSDLFVGALLPGLTLVALYIVWLIVTAILWPKTCPPYYQEEIKLRHLYVQIVKAVLPPAFLVVAVLGSILGGLATPTEAASFGGVGATLLAAVKLKLNMKVIKEVIRSTTRISCMVFSILLGASLFSLTFRGFGGDRLVHQFLTGLPGGFVTAMVVVMVVMFLLGFVLDFIEIVFIVVPIVAPALFAADISPVWLGVMMAMNLQTSFLTPPFGGALFYIRGVAPGVIRTPEIYRGVVPFVVIQLIGLTILAFNPELATWLPSKILN